jgi:hypothetical protein
MLKKEFFQQGEDFHIVVDDQQSAHDYSVPVVAQWAHLKPFALAGHIFQSRNIAAAPPSSRHLRAKPPAQARRHSLGGVRYDGDKNGSGSWGLCAAGAVVWL